jgi:hypothetical protein
MFLVNNKPFVSFDNYVDLNSLFELKPFVSTFIARNNHLIKPTKYVRGNLLAPENTVWYYQNAFEQNINSIENNKLRTELIDLCNRDLFGNYIIFEEEISSGPFTITTRYANNYTNKHLESNCTKIPEDSQLNFFYNWLDNQNIFKEYGRITIFLNYTGTSTVIHKDFPDVNQANSDEFIWLSFNNRKKFFLLDTSNNDKIYLPGHCLWFNTGNYHGSDPAEHACYSIRVDGIFSEDFKQKTF